MPDLIDRNERFEKGLATRREVLGAEYVDKSVAAADEFTAPLQQLVTEHAWNGIWNRPGLDRRSRSLIVLAAMAALNRPHELELHLKGAVNNGLTRTEIREALLQTAIYCGFPAALDAMRVAKKVLDEMGVK